MKLNQVGIDFIKKAEGCKLKAYKCSAGKWTIGYGHTGIDVKSGLLWTKQQANEALERDLCSFIANVNKLVKVILTDNQFAVLVSFAYNVGANGLGDSTLLKLVNTNPNNPKIRDEFMKWVNTGGKKNNGLVNRRKAEADLYFS